MKVFCDFCGKPIDETLASCPECGAVNKHMLRSGNQVPKTIEELQAFIAEHKIPVDKMRFFIGIDYQQPKAFGIFKRPDNQNCVVYKNKSDGTRVIRYEGADEAYAVNEIYQKMKAEFLEHRQVMDRRSFFDGGDYGKGRPFEPFTDYRKPAPRPPQEKFKYSKGNNILGGRDGNAMAAAIAALLFLAVALATSLTSCDLTIPSGFLDSLDSYYVEQQDPDSGYYSYGDDYYYYDDDQWYGLDEEGYWAETEVPNDLGDNYNDYFEAEEYDNLDDYVYFDEYIPDYDSYDYGYDYEYDDSWGDDSWDDDDWDYYYYDSGDDSDYDYDYDYDSDYDSDYDGGWGGVISGGGGWDSDW